MKARDYDLDPLGPLPGSHLVGTVMRRFLISYAVEPDGLAPYLPPGAELSIARGRAWVSACFVHIGDMRPAGMPAALGVGFRYLIHRTRARLPYPDGAMRESVLVLEPNIDRRSLATLGRLAAGVRFHMRDISLDGTDEGWRLRMIDGATTLLDVTIPRRFGTRMPTTSTFAAAAEADAFLLGVAYGGEWHPDRSRVRLVAETHEPWTTQVGTCQTETNAFLEVLGVNEPVADHVITMTDIPHYFAVRGMDVETPMPAASLR